MYVGMKRRTYIDTPLDFKLSRNPIRIHRLLLQNWSNKMFDEITGWPDWANFRLGIRQLITLFDFLKIIEIAQNFRLICFHSESYLLILNKNWLGYILGQFFQNSSGHPVMKIGFSLQKKHGRNPIWRFSNTYT
jgi:hypothetical protein